MSQLTTSRVLRPRLTRDVPTAASCDFTVVVDGTEFRSQRQLLSSVSTYFEAMFRSDMKETLEGRVELTDMRSETFATILNFIHKRVPGLKPSNIDDVWEAANRLDIGIYLQVCETYVIESLSLDNFSYIYQQAVAFNSKNVKDGLIYFMKRNYAHIYQTEVFLNFSFPIILSFVEDEELNVKTEDLVLDGISCWVSHGRQSTGLSLVLSCNDELGKLVEGGCRDCDVTAGGGTGDVTTGGETGDVTTDGKTDDVTTGGETDDVTTGGETVESVTEVQSGENPTSDNSPDPINADPTDDRRKYLAKLLSSAKIILASRRCLEALLTHPHIRTCPDACDVVHEALKFKVGVYPYESSLMIPYRKSCGKRNVMARMGVCSLLLYDLESGRSTTIYIYDKNRVNQTKVSAVSLGSKLAFLSTRCTCDCSYLNHMCRTKAVLTIDENKKMSTLYEVCGKQDRPTHLVSVNGKIFNISRSTPRSRIHDQDLFQILELDKSVKFDFTCVFENNILLFKNNDYTNVSTLNNLHRIDDVTVHCYNLETKSLTTTAIPGISFSRNYTAIHKGTDLFVLVSSGALLAVYKADDKVQFTYVVDLWINEDWMVYGAAYYEGELLLFCDDDGTNHPTILTSVPGVFEKIRVIEVDAEGCNLVPMVVPVSWVQKSARVLWRFSL
ncbi:uncharacterized protein LOC131943548 [Physella acuta]|uniref:uncharacterized protein LOC131943548 n=1 Tax=Physella acuta TaxID=109671 RepID=UPI0027DE6962|nr:uncharacterized protein LOC131943548 [Physella acuta]XP_059159710.1 uncharacterized protein LOC131943548 [Physella acuta]